MKWYNLFSTEILAILFVILNLIDTDNNCFAQRKQDKIYFMDGNLEEGRFLGTSNDTIFFEVRRFKKVYRMRDVEKVLDSYKNALFSQEDYMKNVFERMKNITNIAISTSLSNSVAVSADPHFAMQQSFRKAQYMSSRNTTGYLAGYLADALAYAFLEASKERKIEEKLGLGWRNLSHIREKLFRHKIHDVFKNYTNLNLIAPDSVDLVADTLKNKFAYPAYRIKLNAEALLQFNAHVIFLSNINESKARLLMTMDVEFRDLNPFLRFNTVSFVDADSLMKDANYYYKAENRRNALSQCEGALLSKLKSFLIELQ